MTAADAPAPATQTDALTERVMRVVRDEFKRGAVDTKALRVALRALAAEMGAGPPVDPRQLALAIPGAVEEVPRG